MLHDFEMYRGRLQDVPEDRWEQVLTDLRNRVSVRQIARTLVEEGYLAHLSTTTIRVYLGKIRDSLGLPGYVGQAEEVEKVAKEDEADEVVEGQPALKRLKWVSRPQQGRVRRALKMEKMEGLLLPQASSEIKLMAILLDKESEMAMRTGEVKTVPQAMTLDPAVSPVTDPAEAFRVVLAYRRIHRALAQRAHTEEAEALPAADVPAGDVGPAPAADGAHGRT